MLPQNTKVVILHVEEETIRSRKKDTLHDENLALKIKVYDILSRDLNLKVIDNNRSLSVVKDEIVNYFI